MIDSAMVNIGAAFMLIGGVALVAIVLGLAVYAAGLAWIAASNKWRDILRAESLIYEYRMNRDSYIKWRRNANKTVDSSTSVVRCKDCKHSWEDIGGLCCSHGACVDLTVPGDFYCAYGERKP